MHRDEITKKSVALIVSTLKIPAASVSLDAKLNDLTKDSIQLFEVVLAFEKEFNLEAEYDNLLKIVTVEDVISYLQVKLPQAT